MRVLDRYVIRELLGPLAFCSTALVFFVLMANMFDNLDAIIVNKTPLVDILRYNLALVPVAFVQTISWATLLAVTFLLVKFNTHNEFIAMKSAGLHIARIVFPILYLGFAIGVITFAVNDRLMPPAFLEAEQIKKEKIERKTTQRGEKQIIQNATLFTHNTKYLAKELHTKTNTLYQIDIRMDLPEGGMRVIKAAKAKWIGSKWHFYNVTTYTTDRGGRMVGEPKTYSAKVFDEVSAPPKNLEESTRDVELLNLKELRERISQLQESSLKTHKERVELGRKLAFPWQSLVITLILIPFLAKTHNKRQMAASVLFCLALVITFHLLIIVALGLGQNRYLPAPLSAWLPYLVATFLAVFVLERANH